MIKVDYDFHIFALFNQCYPLGSSYLVGKVLKYKYIEFFVFDYASLPISFQLGIAFPLVALDKNYLVNHEILLGQQGWFSTPHLKVLMDSKG